MYQDVDCKNRPNPRASDWNEPTVRCAGDSVCREIHQRMRLSVTPELA